jgi:phosphatidylglycerophosphatase A
MDAFWLLLAQGLGIGRLPRAPGTFGTLLGFGWLLVALIPGGPWFFASAVILGILGAFWVCGRAEVILGRHDPPSVVLDEIVAVPLCFVPVIVDQSMRTGFPSAIEFARHWPFWLLPAGFVVFRFFDVYKPWPVRQVQSLPGGFGVVSDDLLAAAWVALLSLVLLV